MGTCIRPTHHSMDMEKEPMTTETIQVFFNVIRYMRRIYKWIRTAIMHTIERFFWVLLHLLEICALRFAAVSRSP